MFTQKLEYINPKFLKDILNDAKLFNQFDSETEVYLHNPPTTLSHGYDRLLQSYIWY